MRFVHLCRHTRGTEMMVWVKAKLVTCKAFTTCNDYRILTFIMDLNKRKIEHYGLREFWFCWQRDRRNASAAHLRSIQIWGKYWSNYITLYNHPEVSLSDIPQESMIDPFQSLDLLLSPFAQLTSQYATAGNKVHNGSPSIPKLGFTYNSCNLVVSTEFETKNYSPSWMISPTQKNTSLIFRKWPQNAIGKNEGQIVGSPAPQQQIGCNCVEFVSGENTTWGRFGKPAPPVWTIYTYPYISYILSMSPLPWIIISTSQLFL